MSFAEYLLLATNWWLVGGLGLTAFTVVLIAK